MKEKKVLFIYIYIFLNFFQRRYGKMRDFIDFIDYNYNLLNFSFFFRSDHDALRACTFIRFKMLAICDSTRACSNDGTWLRVINRGANTGQMILGSESREDLQPSRGQANGFGRSSPVATG